MDSPRAGGTECTHSELGALNVYTVQNPGRHVVIKKPAKCVQYVHRSEGICLLVYTLNVSISPGGGTFL